MMKKIIFLTIAFLFIAILNSCKEDSPVTSNLSDKYQWDFIDSAETDFMRTIYAIDENNFYLIGNFNTYKYTNGVRSIINLDDTDFKITGIRALNSNYICFIGYKDSSNVILQKIKIFSDSQISTINLPDYDGFSAGDFIILNQGEFLINMHQKLYQIKNGINISINPPKNSFLNNIIELDDRRLISANSGAIFSLYKLHLDSLIFFEVMNGDYYNFGSTLIKIRTINAFSAFDYLNGNSWSNFYLRSGKNYHSLVGKNLSDFYLLSTDTISSKIYGYNFSDSTISYDSEFPFNGETGWLVKLSNFSAGTMYAMKTVNSNYKIYRRKKIY